MICLEEIGPEAEVGGSVGKEVAVRHIITMFGVFVSRTLLV